MAAFLVLRLEVSLGYFLDFVAKFQINLMSELLFVISKLVDIKIVGRQVWGERGAHGLVDVVLGVYFSHPGVHHYLLHSCYSS